MRFREDAASEPAIVATATGQYRSIYEIVDRQRRLIFLLASSFLPLDPAA
jgi:hypothetical protein